MEILRKLRWVLYPTVFGLVFLLASFCTFPKNVLREMAETSITHAALAIGPRRGLPDVSLEDVSLWRISGMSLHGLSITWPPKKAEAPLVVKFDSIQGRLGIFSLLTGAKSVSTSMELYSGSLDASAKIRRQNTLASLNMSASKIDLGKMEFIETGMGAPMQGIINFVVDLKSSTELSKDGLGSLNVNLDNLTIGPGTVNLPAGGFVSSLTVPKIALGKLTADFTLNKGELQSRVLTLLGGDLEADLSVSVSLGRRPSSSRITGDGWFSIKREFVNTNETLKMLYDLIPELRMAHASDGKVGLSIRGNLARPQFKLERYTGAKLN